MVIILKRFLHSSMKMSIQSAILLSVLLMGSFYLTACSTSNKTVSLTPPPDFDIDTYISPQKYGYDLIIKSDEPQNKDADTTFVPAAFKDDINDGVQRRVNYPSAARRAGIQGKVILELYIDSAGTLTNIKTIQSPHKILTNSCKKTVINAKYNAATLQGKAVNSYIRMPFRFQMWSPNNN